MRQNIHSHFPRNPAFFSAKQHTFAKRPASAPQGSDWFPIFINQAHQARSSTHIRHFLGPDIQQQKAFTFSNVFPCAPPNHHGEFSPPPASVDHASSGYGRGPPMSPALSFPNFPRRTPPRLERWTHRADINETTSQAPNRGNHFRPGPVHKFGALAPPNSSPYEKKSPSEFGPHKPARGESAHFIPFLDQPLRLRTRTVIPRNACALLLSKPVHHFRCPITPRAPQKPLILAQRPHPLPRNHSLPKSPFRIIRWGAFREIFPHLLQNGAFIASRHRPPRNPDALMGFQKSFCG